MSTEVLMKCNMSNNMSMTCNPTVRVKSSDSDLNLAYLLTILLILSINNKPQYFIR